MLVCPETGDRTTSAMPRPHRHDMSLVFIPQAYTGRSRSGYVSPSAGFCRLQREYCGDQPHSGSRTEPATDAAIHPSDRYRIRQSVDDRQQRRRNIQRHTWLSILALVPVLSPLAPATAFSSHVSASLCRGSQRDRAARIVVSDRGGISTIRADGGHYCRLTASVALQPNASPSLYSVTVGAASNPVLSPTGRQLTYLTTTSIDSHDVWIVAAEGTSRGPRRVNTPSPALDREGPSCSPGGRYLAYYEGNPVGRGSPASYAGLTVVIRPVGATRSALVPRVRFTLKGSPNAFIFGQAPTIAWSPDGRKIASIVGFVPGRTVQTWPVGLKVGIADVHTGCTRTITIRFPRGMLGADPGRGSYPTGTNLAWSTDSTHVVISTFGRFVGGALSGVRRVPDGGGVAQLVVGTRADVQEHVPASPPLDGAIEFLSSPNHRLLVTDPANRFWVADATGGHGTFTNTHIGKGCVLAQASWLPDSSGLAYVSECTVAGSGLFRLSLYSVQLRARPRLLLQHISAEPDALDLAPARRCVACA